MPGRQRAADRTPPARALRRVALAARRRRPQEEPAAPARQAAPVPHSGQFVVL